MIPHATGPRVIGLDPECRAEIVAHGRAEHPLEACGLLAVDAVGAVRHVYRLSNADASSTAFTIDPDEHYAALVDAESHGWRLGGVYHSHPNGAAAPSPVDLAAGIDADWVHVIVGFGDPKRPELRVWTVEDGVASELDLAPSSQ